jgi:phosphoribosylaminoimidazole-succinocarboxamide synthase
MKKNQRLPKAILTPSTKAEKGFHDESVSRAQILEMGALSARATSTRAAEMCARVFAFGQQEALRRGLILVDTKYEIGRRPDGTLCFIDEVHTPDSSRYWYADDYERASRAARSRAGLDKEYVRRTLADQGYKGDGPAAQAGRRRPRRGGAPLHPGLRAGHRPRRSSPTPKSRPPASVAT